MSDESALDLTDSDNEDGVCLNCEEEPAVVECADCEDDLRLLCAGCDADLHKHHKMAKHKRSPIKATQQSEQEEATDTDSDAFAVHHVGAVRPVAVPTDTQPAGATGGGSQTARTAKTMTTNGTFAEFTDVTEDDADDDDRLKQATSSAAAVSSAAATLEEESDLDLSDDEDEEQPQEPAKTVPDQKQGDKQGDASAAAVAKKEKEEEEEESALDLTDDDDAEPSPAPAKAITPSPADEKSDESALDLTDDEEPEKPKVAADAVESDLDLSGDDADTVADDNAGASLAAKGADTATGAMNELVEESDLDLSGAESAAEDLLAAEKKERRERERRVREEKLRELERTRAQFEKEQAADESSEDDEPAMQPAGNFSKLTKAPKADAAQSQPSAPGTTVQDLAEESDLDFGDDSESEENQPASPARGGSTAPAAKEESDLDLSDETDEQSTAQPPAAVASDTKPSQDKDDEESSELDLSSDNDDENKQATKPAQGDADHSPVAAASTPSGDGAAVARASTGPSGPERDADTATGTLDESSEYPSQSMSSDIDEMRRAPRGLCENCEEQLEEVFCPECEMSFCDECNAEYHAAAKFQLHLRLPIKGASTAAAAAAAAPAQQQDTVDATQQRRSGKAFTSSSAMSLADEAGSGSLDSKQQRTRAGTSARSRSSSLSTIASAADSDVASETDNNAVLAVDANDERFDEPALDLQLEHVHGYNGGCASRAVGPNLLFVPPRQTNTAQDDDATAADIVYSVAGLAVLSDVARQERQRIFTAHTAEVSCVALHPSKYIVATAQQRSSDGEALVLVWNIMAMAPIVELRWHRGDVVSLSFSLEPGDHLCCVAQSADEPTRDSRQSGAQCFVGLWEWASRRLVAASPAPPQTQQVFFAPSPSSTDSAQAAETGLFVTCSPAGLVLWPYSLSGQLRARRVALPDLLPASFSTASASVASLSGSITASCALDLAFEATSTGDAKDDDDDDSGCLAALQKVAAAAPHAQHVQRSLVLALATHDGSSSGGTSRLLTVAVGASADLSSCVASLICTASPSSNDPITSVCAAGSGVLSAAAGAKLTLWDGALRELQQYDYSLAIRTARGKSVIGKDSSDSTTGAVRAMDCAANIERSARALRRVVLGTRLGSILSVDLAAQGRCHTSVQGHRLPVIGAAFHPTSGQFVTCGSDGKSGEVCLWDSTALTPKSVPVTLPSDRLRGTEVEVSRFTVSCAVRCCAFNHDGSSLALGLDGNKVAVMEYDVSSFVQRFQRECNGQVNALRYSPDGSLLAIGVGADGTTSTQGTTSRGGFTACVQLLRVPDYSEAGSCEPHRADGAGVTTVDFSADGKLLLATVFPHRTCCWYMTDCSSVPLDDDRVQTANWSSMSCPLFSNVKGVHHIERQHERYSMQHEPYSTAVTRIPRGVVPRSHRQVARGIRPAAHKWWSQRWEMRPLSVVQSQAAEKALLVGDSRGVLHVAKYPCQSHKYRRRLHGGHSGALTALAPGLTVDSKGNQVLRVVSGGLDGAVLQWTATSAMKAFIHREERHRAAEAFAHVGAVKPQVPRLSLLSPTAGRYVEHSPTPSHSAGDKSDLSDIDTQSAVSSAAAHSRPGSARGARRSGPLDFEVPTPHRRRVPPSLPSTLADMGVGPIITMTFEEAMQRAELREHGHASPQPAPKDSPAAGGADRTPRRPADTMRPRRSARARAHQKGASPSKVAAAVPKERMQDLCTQLKKLLSSLEMEQRQLNTAALRKQEQLKKLRRIAEALRGGGDLPNGMLAVMGLDAAAVSKHRSRARRSKHVRGKEAKHSTANNMGIGDDAEMKRLRSECLELRRGNTLMRSKCIELKADLQNLQVQRSQHKRERRERLQKNTELQSLLQTRVALRKQLVTERARIELETYQQERAVQELKFLNVELERRVQEKAQTAAEQEQEAQCVVAACRKLEDEYQALQRQVDELSTAQLEQKE